MKKIENLTRRMRAINEADALWNDLLKVRERLILSRFRRVVLMYDIALGAFVMERERVLRQNKTYAA